MDITVLFVYNCRRSQ